MLKINPYEVDRKLVDHARDQVDTLRYMVNEIALKKEGNIYTGMCPFCQSDKSFVVAPKQKNLYCFRCFFFGDIVSFTAKRYGVHMNNAANLIIEEYGEEG